MSGPQGLLGMCVTRRAVFPENKALFRFNFLLGLVECSEMVDAAG